MKTTIHYEYYFFDGSSWIGFATRGELINFLSFGISRLQFIGNNDNDMVAVGDGYVKRYCRVVDEWGHSVYNHELIQEVLAHECDEAALPNWVQYPWLRNYHSKRRQKKQTYRFRRDPVPGIHSFHGGHFFRHIRTTNERRLSAAPEMEEFNRAKRGLNLPTNYDDFPYHWERSWKFQTKNRHQWEAHANRT